MLQRSLRRGLLAPLASALLLALPGAVAADGDGLEEARDGTRAFRDVAAAETAGYGLPPEGPLHECISSFDDTGAMGFHYINGDLVSDTELDPTTPEALVYAPGPDGRVELVALEYVVFAEAWDEANDVPPALFGDEFTFTDEPNRYELPPFYALHAWVWKDNPGGLFSDFNRRVSCEELPDSSTALTGESSELPFALIGLGVAAFALLLGRPIARRRAEAQERASS